MAKKAGRNKPCPCGSGKKYKHCYLRKDAARRAGFGTPAEVFTNLRRPLPQAESIRRTNRETDSTR